MKKILIAFAFSLLSVTAFAEATFQQVETFIEQQQYEVASLALKEIIANHPNSAKAYYAMSQAQAGLGNLEKAQFALNKAKSIDPELKFATSSNISSLEQAITPQTKKIEVVTESHFWRNLFIALVVAGLFYGLYRFFTRKRDDVDTRFTGVDYGDPKPSGPKGPTGPTNPSTPPPSATSSPAPAPSYGYSSAPTPTVVNNHYGSNNDGLLTGVLVGEMLANNSHHHDTVIVEQPVYVAPTYVAPAPSRSSSWDDTPDPSRSSSWDDDSSSRKSSSWDSDSSSSSSSWDSSSSSSDSWSSSDSSSDNDW